MMTVKKAVACLIILLNMLSVTGCWNYRELNQMAIVAGVAIDKSKANNGYILTIEVVNTSAGKEKRIPDLVSMEGTTIFDAVRNTVAKLGRKLYWSHAKVAIISQDIAREGIVPVLDFMNRDPEIRTDIWLLISKDKMAGEVLKGKDKYHDTLSYHIGEALRNQNKIGKYASIEMWQYINDLSAEGISAVLPITMLVSKEDEKVPVMDGTAVFKKDKMVGRIDMEETRSMLIVKGKFKNGVIVVPDGTGKGTETTIEVLGSKSKIKPILIDGEPAVKVDIQMDVDLAEIMGSEDLISKKGREALQKKAEEVIKGQVENTIRKVQGQYKSDIFGFGNKIQDVMPDYWKRVSKDWEDIFAGLDVIVDVKINITGSALNSKPIKMGD